VRTGRHELWALRSACRSCLRPAPRDHLVPGQHSHDLPVRPGRGGSRTGRSHRPRRHARRPPLRFESTMDAVLENRCGHGVRWALFMATTLDGAGGLLDHPRVVNHVERLLFRGLLLSQPHTYSGPACRRLEPGPPSSRQRRDRPDGRPAGPRVHRRVARPQGRGQRPLACRTGFRQHLGMSPMQYLRTVRLRGARADLLALDPDDRPRLRRWRPGGGLPTSAASLSTTAPVTASLRPRTLRGP
jgi:hypothetical protein